VTVAEKQAIRTEASRNDMTAAAYLRWLHMWRLEVLDAASDECGEYDVVDFMERGGVL
jgi:hypothetical protein